MRKGNDVVTQVAGPAWLPAAPSFELVETKLRPPAARAGVVTRPALVERLHAAHGLPIISVSAPPGYGKTTLLAQWSQTSPGPVAWVSIDEHDNDPAVFLTYT